MFFCYIHLDVYCMRINYVIMSRKKTNHPMSSYSHPLTTANKSRYLLTRGGGWL